MLDEHEISAPTLEDLIVQPMFRWRDWIGIPP